MSSPLDRLAREALLANGFQPEAGEAVVREVARLEEAPTRGVRDERHLLWSSIDNATSRDLDQIEVAEELDDGAILLRIGIADVDARVPKGSATDAHAFVNTTSVYTGVSVYPMLPERLSTDLTSLNEGEDRLVMVIEIELGADGAVRRHGVYRALATNHAKFVSPHCSLATRRARRPGTESAATVMSAEMRLGSSDCRLLAVSPGGPSMMIAVGNCRPPS